MSISFIIYKKMPNRLRKALKKILSKDKKDSLINKLSKYDIISFDIFDTLITRAIYNPDDVFVMMDKKLEKYRFKTSFLDMRKKAEHEARLELKKDVNLDEIYNKFQKLYSISDKDINEIKKLEVDIEYKLICPRKDMIDVLNVLYKKGKKIILTSDMYLNKNIIINMLDKCGYKQGVNYHEFYLSNDINKRKDDYTMWDYLKTIYNKNKMIHVGDNINSDYNYPKKCGIKALHVPNPKEQFASTYFYKLWNVDVGNLTINNSIYLGYIINEQIFNSPFINNISLLETLANTFYAPILLKYLDFINNNVENNDKLLFLSREGYILEKLYKDYCKIFKRKEVEHHYFLSSRKAAMSSTIDNDEDILNYIKRDYFGTIKELFNTAFDIDYTGEDFDIILPRDYDKVSSIVLEYKDKIIKKAKKYKGNYLKYIDSLKINYKKDDLVIIDLGYSGTIQYHLSKLFGRDLKGIYLTNSDSVKKYSNKSKLLFAFDINDNDSYKGIYLNSLIMEYFLSAPYGQLQYFEENKNGIEPIYNDETMDDQKQKNIDSIYEYVINYFNRIKDINEIYKLDFSKELICSCYISIMDSYIINRDVKDLFMFSDSFTTSEARNIFRIIDKY